LFEVAVFVMNRGAAAQRFARGFFVPQNDDVVEEDELL
jgi:hypothetical protein